MKKTVVYFGYNWFAGCLSYFVENPYDVVAIVSDQESNYTDEIYRIARRNGVTVYTSEEALWSALSDEFKPDIIFCGAFSKKIKRHEFAQYAINVHPTMLPHGRGPNPLHTFFGGMGDICGVTFHKMTDVLDGGDLLLQRRLRVLPCDNRETIAFKLRWNAREMMDQLFIDIDSTWANCTPQGAATYVAKASSSDRTLDLTVNGDQIARKLKAWASIGVIANICGKPHELHDAAYTPMKHSSRIGEIAEMNAQRVVIFTADGILLVRGQNFRLFDG